MCTTPVPRLSVPKEAEPPAEPRYGLFSAATIVEDPQEHALNGVQYVSVCDPGIRLQPAPQCEAGSPPKGPQKTGERTIATTTADPFALYAAETCFPGGRSSQEARELLRRRITRGERHLVEAAVDSGRAGARPWLRDPDTEVLAEGRALPLEDAIGALEHRFAELGRAAIIHSPRWTAARLDAEGAVHRDGPRVRTLLGNAFAFGSGYSGRPPEGVEDDGALWLYATGHVTIRRSPVIEPATWTDGAFNPTTNSAFLLAERMYVVDWPCGAVAVKTTLQRAYTPPDPPWPAPGLTVDPASGPAPLEVTAAVDNWGAGPVEVDWGDGTAPVTVEDGGTATHTYDTPDTYTVTATSQADPSATATAQVRADPGPVNPPQDLSATGSTTSTIDTSWTWSQGTGEQAQHFLARHRTPPGTGTWSEPVQLDPSARSHTFTGLDPDTSYELEITAVGATTRAPASTTGATQPVPDPEVTSTPATGVAPLDVQITVDNHGNGPVDIDFGDGTDGAVNPGDGTTATAHAYTAADTYTVTATSQAEPNPQGTATVTVTSQ